MLKRIDFFLKGFSNDFKIAKIAVLELLELKILLAAQQW